MIDANHPDPAVLALPDKSGYVMVSTDVHNGSAFPIMTSTDLINWQKVILAQCLRPGTHYSAGWVCFPLWFLASLGHWIHVGT